jgi:hypothetical protein
MAEQHLNPQQQALTSNFQQFLLQQQQENQQKNLYAGQQASLQNSTSFQQSQPQPQHQNYLQHQNYSPLSTQHPAQPQQQQQQQVLQQSQLQQNLIYLQQQQQQRPQSELSQQPEQQPPPQTICNAMQPDTITELHKQNEQDSNDMMSQYRQLFGGLFAGNEQNNNNRMMIQSKVEPFRRDSAASNDDQDLWKVFDEEVRICIPV